jgi:UDP-N-acetylglucosamine--N-acetylmuramyl-(pentapeptide) pyrophosphoryl-undecaprenol N-acetylglucosamine transferase
MGVPVASGWRDCEPLPRSRYVMAGVPVRSFANIPRAEAWKLMGLGDEPPKGPVVSVMTGSLGSGSLAAALGELSGYERFASWRFLIIDPRAEKPSRVNANTVRLPRMWDISPFYAAADILLTRGGASSLAEAEALGKPAVIAPWRGAADDHQLKNARCLSDSGKFRVWDEKKDSPADLADKLQGLYLSHSGKNGDSENLLYNLSETGDANCRRLWDFAADFFREEI